MAARAMMPMLSLAPSAAVSSKARARAPVPARAVVKCAHVSPARSARVMSTPKLGSATRSTRFAAAGPLRALAPGDALYVSTESDSEWKVLAKAEIPGECCTSDGEAFSPSAFIFRVNVEASAGFVFLFWVAARNRETSVVLESTPYPETKVSTPIDAKTYLTKYTKKPSVKLY